LELGVDVEEAEVALLEWRDCWRQIVSFFAQSYADDLLRCAVAMTSTWRYIEAADQQQ
jgi:hypothetical protein